MVGLDGPIVRDSTPAGAEPENTRELWHYCCLRACGYLH